MRHLDPLHIKLLLVEDDEDDYFFFEDLLDDFQSIQFDLDWADTYDKGLQAVQRHQHDIYVFDFRLGSRTGLDLLEEVVSLGHRIPIILLTGQEDREIDLALSLIHI